MYGYTHSLAPCFRRSSPVTDLTITFVESRRPQKLLEHLNNVRGYLVEKTNPGIYTVSGDILPIQVIDNRKLSVEEAKRKGKTARIQAYIEAIAKANHKAVKEAINMGNTTLELEKVFEEVGWIAKWREIEALDIAKNMANSGFPIETIVAMTKLDPEKVEKLYQGADN